MKLFVSILFIALSLFAQEEITIKSKDGYLLYGWLEYPAKVQETYPLAFFAHQFGSDHSIWNDMAAKLREQGYATLNIDLRGHGKSILQNGKENGIVNNTNMDHIREALAQSREKVKFEKIPQDISLWLEYASNNDKLDMESLILFGSSLGAGSILPIIADFSAKAAVLVSPGGGDEHVIKDALSLSETPILFISGKNDPLKAQERASQYAVQAMKGTNLMISSGGHGTVLLPWVEGYIFTFIKMSSK